MMTALLLLFLPGLAPGQAQAPKHAAVVHERKEAQGRVLRRVVFNEDGTVHRTAFAYGAGAAQLTVDEVLDSARNPVRRRQEKFDERGRITEREETTLEDRSSVRKRTTFHYDAAGRATTETEAIE